MTICVAPKNPKQTHTGALIDLTKGHVTMH